MRSHYKRIGDYVTQIKLKNTDDSISSLKGININKHFMPSVANINGTDLSKYRVVKKNQFAFNPMHVGRDEVLPISMLEDDEPIIVSPAYVVFEVKDEEELLPAYLMMWCRRSEFDRNAWFMTDNSVRGGFSWADFCDMELPVPSIEKQREIVREYNVVNDRIALNEQLTQKLEDTAQALYKQWFVDFEFPISKEYAKSIGKPELEGKPYKSSGGEMQESEATRRDVPKGWRVGTYESYLTFKTGKLNSNAAVDNGKYPFFTCSSETYKTDTYAFDGKAVLLAGNNASAIYPLKYFEGKFDAYQRTYVITPKVKNLSLLQVYFSIKDELEGFKGSSSGTATKFLTMKILNPLNIVVAPDGVYEEVNRQLDILLDQLLVLPKELALLKNLSPILQAKISKA